MQDKTKESRNGEPKGLTCARSVPLPATLAQRMRLPTPDWYARVPTLLLGRPAGTTAPAFRLQPRASPPEHRPNGELAMLKACRELEDRANGEAPVDVRTPEEPAQVASASARTVSARQACTLAAAARGGGWYELRAEADAARASRRARRGLRAPRGDDRGEREADRRAATRRSCCRCGLGGSA